MHQLLLPGNKQLGYQKLMHYFAAQIMNRGRKTYTLFQKTTSIFLMITLTWLTVSSPFVAKAQQELAKQQKMQSACSAENCSGCNEEESTNNNIEEKVPGSTNLVEEFLHDHHISHHFVSAVFLYHKLENADNYTAFHGELLVPPPNTIA